MGKRITVMLFGKMIRKGIQIDADATEGATVGKDLRWPDGSVISEQDIRNPSGGGTTTVNPGVIPTLWSLILNIPAFIKSLAALATTGLVVRDGSGAAVTRTITAEDARILVTNGDGVAANPVIGMTDWPVVKNSISTGEAYTVPTGYQLIVWDTFVFDGGALTLDGDLIAL